ncbi:NAD(P)/FAD-dependent oxidoreductase [Arthrobacter caoxuetaonis]|uniref:FAD-binding oxidoreductase n=1 Tax=Arthrobacter caoxuetaonis TaxID=2886935 RepID=A0A9X1SAW4_9MICC|nr:FAD-dependent oxidoreductase [Arthrobacter caoxuetaonis]MCC3297145.1 FAD-binding oxidoreductase [Arthrobacter caoxuetaonis]USQ58295.1 FAD-binding oxidoreductase [Arthrobacter caoxuetaonis]
MNDAQTDASVLVIGGGIAGLSLASKLARDTAVVLLEAESVLAYHTSSRSARQLIPSYGPPAVQDLTIRTLALIRELEANLPQPILAPRSFMLVGTEEDVRDRASGHMHPITVAEAVGLAPELVPGAFESAGLDTTSVSCNTDILLDWHRRRIEAAGGKVLTGRRVDSAERTAAGQWLVSAGGEVFRASLVVNAAGAWADAVAALFGVRERGLQPLRRTAAIVEAANPPAANGPMVASAADTFYYRPDLEGVLISPAESVPSPAEDARHVPQDIAALIELVNSETSLGLGNIVRAWTGLRTEAPDGLPVVGFDDAVPGFFWLAGQGGYGFQTSSGIAEMAAAQILGRDLVVDVAGDLSPARPGL